jgi:hypothetical protein
MEPKKLHQSPGVLGANVGGYNFNYNIAGIGRASDLYQKQQSKFQ